VSVQQDAGVRHLRAHLSTVLDVLRVLAGRRGWAQVTWHGQGFTYTLFTVRDPYADPAAIHVADDPDVTGLGAQDHTPLRDRLAELLEVQP
jgi:hypothetical protein